MLGSLGLNRVAGFTDTYRESIQNNGFLFTFVSCGCVAVKGQLAVLVLGTELRFDSACLYPEPSYQLLLWHFLFFFLIFFHVCMSVF